MPVEASTEALLALELFQLSADAKKSRKSLNKHLTEVAMFTKADARSTNEIVASVLTLLNNAIVFGHDECKEALDMLVIEGRIVELGNDNYKLSDETEIKLSESIERIKQAEKKFDQGLAESVGRATGKVLNPFAEAVLCKVTKEVIQDIFYHSTLKLRKLLSGDCDFSILLETDSNAESKLAENLQAFVSLEPDSTVERTMIGIKGLLGHLNEAQKHFIGSLHYRVVYFQILNVDPRLQKLEEECFKAMRLYLDTNVVIRYMCEDSPNHEPIADVLGASKKLGAKLLISSKTFQETGLLIKEAKSFSMYLNDQKIGPALLANPIAVNNPLIQAFITKRRGNPKLNWSAFISPFNNFEIYLITKDVEMNDDNCGDILSDDLYSRIRTTIADEAWNASANIIDHDAYNLLLIQKLRGVHTTKALGSSVWLLTIDRKLPKVDRRLHSIYPQPHCQTIEQWGTILLPFQNIGTFMASDEYISYLASQELGAIFPEQVLDIHFFEGLEQAEVDLDEILRLDPEIAFQSLIDLQQDREAQVLLKQIRSMPAEEKEAAKKEFRERSLAIISKCSEEEKNLVEAELTRLRNGIQELSEVLHNMESDRVKNAENIELIKQKLDMTKAELGQYEHMSFWQRVKYVLRRRVD
jgi:hypothetical protein